VLAAAALATALALGAPNVDLQPVVTELSLGALRVAGGAPPLARPDLALHLVAARSPGELAVDAPRNPSGPRGAAGSPVCSFDVCAPVVSVPGFEPSFGRAHRSEAFVALLTKANIEPVATIAWALVATGLRFDWSPPAFDGPNAGGHGWGSVMLRLRLRLDADSRVVVPPRPR
jgi:hypothetical protein